MALTTKRSLPGVSNLFFYQVVTDDHINTQTSKNKHTWITDAEEEGITGGVLSWVEHILDVHVVDVIYEQDQETRNHN